MSTSPPAWHPDPLGRHQFRWWDGTQWTGQVADGGVPVYDAEGLAPPAAPGGATVATGSATAAAMPRGEAPVVEPGPAASETVVGAPTPRPWQGPAGATPAPGAAPPSWGSPSVSAPAPTPPGTPYGAPGPPPGAYGTVQQRRPAPLAWIAVGAGVLVFVAAFLPWVTVSGPFGFEETVHGTSEGRDGMITLLFSLPLIVLGVLTALGVIPRWAGWILAAIAVIVGLIGLIDTVDPGVDDTAFLDVTVGIGLWLTDFGALLAAIGGVLAAVVKPSAAQG